MNQRPRPLCYVDDRSPGITRRRRGRYWQYFGPDGERITDREEIDRLNAVGLPPAYQRAWFCPDPNGHIQAIGYDDRGRKQYRYHPDFREQQDSLKFERMAAFGHSLTRLRRRVARDIKGPPTRHAPVVAAVVRLIDATHMRVGNENYARENKSFGATTLRSRHAEVARGKLRICFAGKHGVKRTVTVSDASLARIARRTMDLPGQQLFAFLDDEGEVRPVTSSDVNQYIKDATGEEFTAKDFRTWGASVIAFEEMVKRARKSGKVGIKAMIEPVAEALGNTLAISRNSYVHPALVEAAAEAESLCGPFPRKTRYLSGPERGLIDFLDALDTKRPARAGKKSGAKGAPRRHSGTSTGRP